MSKTWNVVNNGRLRHWLSTNAVILSNASSIVGALVANSALGFAYWWFAARQFSPQAVGLGSAAISAMMLLGTIGALGLGTLLIGELPRRAGQKTALIFTALVAAGGAGGALGFLFALAAPFISGELNILSENIFNLILFAVGVSLTAVTLVLDQALVGLLRGSLQFWRNGIFSVAKLIILFMGVPWVSEHSGLSIYAAWLGGNLISLLVLAGLAVLNGVQLRACRLQWGLIRQLGRAALSHHALNLVLQAPNQALPVVVTVLLSAQMNAYFYAAWMMAGFAFFALAALATVLYAVGAASPITLAHKLQTTVRLSIALCLVTGITVFVGADWVLRLFGDAYSGQAAWCLRVLSLATFPLIAKYHYVALCRIRGSVLRAAQVLLVASLVELGLAIIGARIGSLLGLSLGWVVAVYLEGLFMARTLYHVTQTRMQVGGQPVLDGAGS